MVGDLHARWGREVRRDGDAAEHRVDGVPPVRRHVRPRCAVVAQVADHDGVARHLVAVDVEHDARVDVVHRLARRRTGAVVERLVRVERATPDRIGHVDRLGEMGDLVLRQRVGEELERVAERAREPAAVVELDRRAAGVPVRVKPPQEDADVRDVEAPAPALDPPHLDGVRDRLERAADAGERFPAAQVRRVVVERAQMVHVLRRREPLEVLDGARVPAGDVARDLLEHRHRALAPRAARSCARPRRERALACGRANGAARSRPGRRCRESSSRRRSR